MLRDHYTPDPLAIQSGSWRPHGIAFHGGVKAGDPTAICRALDLAAHGHDDGPEMHTFGCRAVRAEVHPEVPCAGVLVTGTV